MAEKDLDLDIEDDKPKTKKGMLIIIIVVVLLLVGGGAAFFLMSGGEKAEKDGEEMVEEVKMPAIFVHMKPPFVSNFKIGGRQRYLQIETMMMTRDSEVAPQLKKHLPFIRNIVINTISVVDYESLKTKEGKESLRIEILNEIKKFVEEEIGESQPEDLLYTSFVMQ